MYRFKNYFKNAFTLMEIGLSLLIISILVVVCVPIASNQMKKSDEYAYYMAFKTVEKIGMQILAYGDANQSLATNTAPSNNNYFAHYTDKLFKFVNPVAHAETQTSEVVSFPSYEYDYVRLCLGNNKVEKSSGVMYSDAEIAAIQAQTLCTFYRESNSINIKKRFICNNVSGSETENIINNILNSTSMSAESYCSWLVNNKCGSSGYSYKYKTYDDKNYGECIISIKKPDSAGTSASITDPPIQKDITCNLLGYINMTKDTNDVCVCDSTHPYKALNNSSVCCGTPDTGKQPYYKSSTSGCIFCKQGTFDEITQKCCPNNSFYSQTLGKCECIDGYTPDDANNPTTCTSTTNSCPAGTHKEGSTCVANKPINSAKKFCELIKYNWNINNGNCNTFTENSGVKYNPALYNAATAVSSEGKKSYLSVEAKKGAFNSITPNIVFSNGLRLWILGDRSASIAGLSFNPDGYNPEVNVCREIKPANLSTCTALPNYYCQNDNACYTINQGSSDTHKLIDARNCCSTAEYNDLYNTYGVSYTRELRTISISGFTVFVDINGTKDNDTIGGGGTLWKDVFPFFIGTNGKVYPAYPLNAAKVITDGKPNYAIYQGGNSSYLSTDVFYYDIVDGKRKKIVAYPSISYARALCYANELSVYTPYCLNLDKRFRGGSNPCGNHKCFIKLKNKIKYL